MAALVGRGSGSAWAVGAVRGLGAAAAAADCAAAVSPAATAAAAASDDADADAVVRRGVSATATARLGDDIATGAATATELVYMYSSVPEGGTTGGRCNNTVG